MPRAEDKKSAKTKKYLEKVKFYLVEEFGDDSTK